MGVSGMLGVNANEPAGMGRLGAPVLLTGFEAFGGDESNPSAAVVRELDGTVILGHPVIGRVLPVSLAKVGPALEEAWAAVGLAFQAPSGAGATGSPVSGPGPTPTGRQIPGLPAAIISLGLAKGRTAVAVERVALNVADFNKPDNDGVTAADASLVAEGPPAYFSTLPCREIVARLRGLGIPAYISNTAGTFICNQVMYLTLDRLARGGVLERVRAGFIHLPADSASVAKSDEPPVASLPLPLLIEATSAAVEVTLESLAIR